MLHTDGGIWIYNYLYLFQELNKISLKRRHCLLNNRPSSASGVIMITQFFPGSRRFTYEVKLVHNAHARRPQPQTLNSKITTYFQARMSPLEESLYPHNALEQCISDFISNRAGKGRETAVKGTALDKFSEIIENSIQQKFPSLSVLKNKAATVPGYFRPAKNWDLVIKNSDVIIAAIELKSLTRSHGNNYNNRVEECLGCAVDLKTYYRKHPDLSPPFLGYLLIMNEAEETQRKRNTHENSLPHFVGTSYLDRAKLLCKSLTEENLYNCAEVITYRSEPEPSPDQTTSIDGALFHSFMKGLISHCGNKL